MTLQVIDISFEHHPDGFGIGLSAPRLSWRFAHGQPPTQNWKQTAYEVEIARGSQHETELLRVDSANSLFSPWPSRPLDSRERASVRVRAFGGSSIEGRVTIPAATDWSDWHMVEAGLLQPSDWTADYITSPVEQPKDWSHRPLAFRKVFHIPLGFDIGSRLYITSLGVYEAHINGLRVGDQHMTPGWTSYKHRLQYQVYDISELLREGENIVTVEIAEGWYGGRLTWGEGIRNFYGDTLAFIAQLEIRRHGQSLQTIVSDCSWGVRESALITSELYDGELYDMREEDSVSQNSGVEFQSARILDTPKATLFSPDAPPVRVTEQIQPRDIFKSKSGKTIIDFGQNLVGKLNISSLRKPPGHILTIRHAEVLENGELCTRPLRNAKAEDTIIFSSAPLEDWSPRFTFHGFRYASLDGWSLDDADPPTTSNIRALVLHSDLKRTGHFRSSNPLLNQLHTNILWSMRGNILSLPTDCPQRDERLGWTGDIQVFAPTAAFLYSSAGFLANWLQDLALDQSTNPDSIVPLVVPDVLGHTSWPTVPQAVWDDAAILVPWHLYRASADPRILARQLPSMRAHLDAAVRRGPDGLWDDDLWQLGDWLDPAAPANEPGLARTDGALVADAYLVHVTGIMAQACGALPDREADRDRYAADHERLRRAFRDKYVAPSGLVVGDTQTALALALCFGLLDDNDDDDDNDEGGQRQVAAKRLARLVRMAKFRVSTGFAGTPVVLRALAREGGYVQLAYRMLLEERCPSWLYPVTMGATTVWERWDSMLPDGSVNPGEMTSFNHYALGSVADWLHGCVAGISPLEPGWRRFRVAPLPGGDVTWARAEFEGPYGLVEVAWCIVDGDGDEEGGKVFRLKVQVPPNSEALVVMPKKGNSKGVWYGSGVYELEAGFEALGEWPPKAIYTQFEEGRE